MTNSELIDLLERIKLTHEILNELRGNPLPILQKLDEEIDKAIVYLQMTSPGALQCWEDAIEQRRNELRSRKK